MQLLFGGNHFVVAVERKRGLEAQHPVVRQVGDEFAVEADGIAGAVFVHGDDGVAPVNERVVAVRHFGVNRQQQLETVGFVAADEFDQQFFQLFRVGFQVFRGIDDVFFRAGGVARQGVGGADGGQFWRVFYRSFVNVVFGEALVAAVKGNGGVLCRRRKGGEHQG